MNLYNLVFRMVFLIVRYINKMGDGGGGAMDGRQSDDCKRDIGPGLKSQPGYIFFTNFCTNSYKRIHTMDIQIVWYKFVHGVVFVPIHTIFTRIAQYEFIQGVIFLFTF